jgi:F-type H+-transporting ATPase subunit delta
VIQSRVTRRYANALFELAFEKNQVSEISDDLRKIQEVCTSSEDFIRLLDSPVIQVSEKKQVLSRLFEKRIHPLTFYFLELLLEKNRENLLPDTIKYFMRLVDDSQGIMRGELQTAYLLSEQQIEALKKRLDRITGKNVLLHQNINPDLLGGFMVKLDDTVIDTSIRNQLLKMRENFLSNA